MAAGARCTAARTAFAGAAGGKCRISLGLDQMCGAVAHSVVSRLRPSGVPNPSHASPLSSLAQVAPTLLPSSGPNVPIGRSQPFGRRSQFGSEWNERGLWKGRRRRSRLPSPLPFHYNSRHVDARPHSLSLFRAVEAISRGIWCNQWNGSKMTEGKFRNHFARSRYWCNRE